MAVAYKAAGTFQSGTAALSVPWPSGHASGDYALLVVETANENITLPSGWGFSLAAIIGTGTAAAAGGVKVWVFDAFATSGAMANAAVNDSGNHQTAQIFTFTGVDTTTPVNTYALSTQASAASNWTLPAVTTTVANCMIVHCLANDRDLASTTNLSAWTNANLTSLTERADQTVSTGVGGGIGVATGLLASAGSSGSTTVTNAASNTAAFATIALAPVPTGTVYDVGISEGASAADVKTGGFTQSASKSEAASAADSLSAVSITYAYHSGYIAGKVDTTTTMQAIRYATETAVTLSNGAYGLANHGDAIEGTGSGYYQGGTSLPGTSLCAITFDTEAYTLLTSMLSVARIEVAGVSSKTKGYLAGSSNGTGTASIDGLVYATQAVSNPTATLTVARGGGAGVFSGTIGYFCGGYNGSSTYYPDIDSIVYATETSADPAAALSSGRQKQAASQSATKGYVFGGYASGGAIAQISALTFSGETLASIGASLSSAKYGFTAVENSTDAYISCGAVAPSELIQKFNFGTETLSTTAITLANYSANYYVGMTARGDATGNFARAPVAESQVSAIAYGLAAVGAASASDLTNFLVGTTAPKAFMAGGNASPSGSSPQASIQTFLYSTEAISGFGQSAPTGIYGSACTQTPTSGYWMGGNTAGGNASVYTVAIDYLPELVRTTAANLSKRRGSPVGISSSAKGYACGTYNPLRDGSIDSMRYLDETAVSVSASFSSNGRAGGCSSATKGYISVGAFSNTIEGLTFGTEAVASIAAVLSVSVVCNAGFSSGTKGYFCGGYDGGVMKSTIDSLTFATEARATLSTTLATARDYLNGFASLANGYCAGGQAVNNTTNSAEIDGIIFSSEAANNPSASIGTAVSEISTVSSTGYNGLYSGATESGTAADFEDATVADNFRYIVESATAAEAKDFAYTGLGLGVFVGGNNGAGTRQSSTDILNFNNEAFTTGPAQSPVGSDYGAASVTGYGIYAGGYFASSPGIDVCFWYPYLGFGNAQSAALVDARYRMGSVGSSTVGYFSGGTDSGGTAQSNTSAVRNSTTAGYVAALALAAAKTTATGLSFVSYGYQCGGYNTTPTSVSTVERINFSGETLSTVSGALDRVRRQAAGFTSSDSGYLCGGSDNSSSTTSISKFILSSETTAAMSATLAITRNYTSGVRSAAKGFVAGGYDNVSSATADMESVVYSNDTVGNPTAALSVARASLASTSTVLPGASTTQSGDRTEAASAAAIHDSIGSQSLSISETATAAHSDTATATELAIGSISEPTTASDTPTVVMLAPVAITEAASAAATSVGDRLAYALIAEAGSASDSSNRTLTIFLSEDEGATAFDLSSVSAAFVAQMNESALATDTPGTASGISVFVQEMAVAAAEAYGWLTGSDGFKRLTVLVATAGKRTICYLKPVPTTLVTDSKPTTLVTATHTDVFVTQRSALSFVEKTPK